MDIVTSYEQLLNSNVFASVTLVLALVVARVLLGKAINKRAYATPQMLRRWTANLRNLFLLLGVIGFVLIWAPQLRTFALSLTAVAVAVVVATKELILCLSGSILRATSRAFAVGDWVELSGVRGEVVDHNLLVTVIDEFGTSQQASTSADRKVIIPNSMLFGSAIRSERPSLGHVFHRFAITLEPNFEVFGRTDRVIELIEETYQPFRERAEMAHRKWVRHNRSGGGEEVLGVGFATTELGKWRIDVSLFLPADQKGGVESEITCKVLEFLTARQGEGNEDVARAADADV